MKGLPSGGGGAKGLTGSGKFPAPNNFYKANKYGGLGGGIGGGIGGVGSSGNPYNLPYQ